MEFFSEPKSDSNSIVLCCSEFIGEVRYSDECWYLFIHLSGFYEHEKQSAAAKTKAGQHTVSQPGSMSALQNPFNMIVNFLHCQYVQYVALILFSDRLYCVFLCLQVPGLANSSNKLSLRRAGKSPNGPCLPGSTGPAGAPGVPGNIDVTVLLPALLIGVKNKFCTILDSNLKSDFICHHNAKFEIIKCVPTCLHRTPRRTWKERGGR